MIGLALGFLRIAWPYILAALVAGYVYHRAETWCNSACVKQQALTKVATDRAVTAESKLDVLDKARIRQQEQWAQAMAAEEARAKLQEAKRVADAARLAERIRRDPNSAALRFSPGTDKLLHDIAAPTEAAAAPAVSDGAGAIPATTEAEVYDEREFKLWINDIRAAFDKVTGQKQSCINRYNSIGDSSVLAP